jgi:dTDP-4-dehydrorhamnose 3,5-epimerase-like enzyme
VLSECKLIELPKVTDPRGNLTAVEGSIQVPFEIRRVFYLYDVPGAATRGGHAHRQLEQLIIAVSGSLDVSLDDGHQQQRFHMNRSNCGLYVCPMIWHELSNFTPGSVCLVLASQTYSEVGYYRNYTAFLKAAEALNP